MEDYKRGDAVPYDVWYGLEREVGMLQEQLGKQSLSSAKYEERAKVFETLYKEMLAREQDAWDMFSLGEE